MTKKTKTIKKPKAKITKKTKTGNVIQLFTSETDDSVSESVDTFGSLTIGSDTFFFGIGKKDNKYKVGHLCQNCDAIHGIEDVIADTFQVKMDADLFSPFEFIHGVLPIIERISDAD